ncbi:RNA polymerase II degradation factor 1-like isoform X3 [Daphnia pulex]|uniref:RNA polymerase II degradation factor 1-like isoform X3 n=1 Tax=Daphnia pulex TaxID=6669 RepID=UPI001EDD15E0|nr:RNA polymerase II degradation factor 1-like isoform X3 [Daphnia pulex]
MDSTKNEEVTLEQYEMADDSIPSWAITLFTKMKTEICAEVHAKVAYSMRIMLDQFHEDLKSSLRSFHEPITADECSCKELNKCSEKLAALCGSQNLKAKEEKKKRMKRIQQEIKKSNKLQKNNYETPKVAPPIPPRKSSPSKSLVQTADFSDTTDVANSAETTDPTLCNKELLVHLTKLLNLDRQELLDGPAETSNIEEQSPEFQLCSSEKDDNSQMASAENSLEQKLQNQESPVSQTSEVFSPSDSEFEVISMPPNVNPVSEYARLPRDMSPLISDYDDSSSSSDDFETETKVEFKDCKQMSVDNTTISQTSGTLYPALELKKMSLSMSTMTSSTNSTVLDGYMSSCSTEGAVALEPVVEPILEIERERAPYCVPSEEVEKINRQEIVHSQPLPSEFLRDRKPYSHSPMVESEQQPQKQQEQQQQPQQPQQIPKVSRPPRHYQRDSNYRVDNIPESLWDETLTVAAQTYNAAKTAIGNLADTFVPGVASQAAAVSPQPRSSPVRTQPAYRIEMASKEQKLFEMGFLDHGLNATLLIRHNGDMDRVIAELIEPI